MKYLVLILAFYLSVNHSYSQSFQSQSGEVEYALIEASRLKMLGNIEDAFKLYKMAADSDPDCAAAWYEMASIYSVMGMYKDSETFIQKAYSLDKTNYWYINAYVDILRQNEKYPEAIKILQRAIKSIPQEEVFFRFSMADNFFLNGDLKMALKEYNSIEKKFGVSEISTIRKIEIYKNLNKDKKVVKTYKNVLEVNPTSIPIYLMYAEYLNESGKPELATQQYEKVILIDETNIFAISNLADIYRKLGQNERSYDYLIKAFTSDEISSEKKLQTLAYMMNDESRVTNDADYLELLINTMIENEPYNYDLLLIAYDFYFKRADYETSFDIISQLVDLKDDNYIIWAQSLYNANLIEDYDEIINLGYRALKVFPNKDDIRVFIALAYYQNGKHLETYELLKKTENRFTEPGLQKQKILLLAETAYKSGFIDEAFEYFENILEEDQNNIYVKNNYSYYLALEERSLERAEILSKETIIEDPDNPTFLDTYGWILYKMGRIEEAEYYIRKAVNLDESDNPEILNHLLKILIFNNKTEEAELIKIKLKDEL